MLLDPGLTGRKCQSHFLVSETILVTTGHKHTAVPTVTTSYGLLKQRLSERLKGPLAPGGVGPEGRCLTPTCVVMLGAVSQVLLLLQDELGQSQSICHLHSSLLLPLKDEVVHGVSNWDGTRRRSSHHPEALTWGMSRLVRVETEASDVQQIHETMLLPLPTKEVKPGLIVYIYPTTLLPLFLPLPVPYLSLPCCPSPPWSSSADICHLCLCTILASSLFCPQQTPLGE